MCPMLGDEDPEDIEIAERDYKVLKDRGEINAKAIARKSMAQ